MKIRANILTVTGETVCGERWANMMADLREHGQQWWINWQKYDRMMGCVDRFMRIKAQLTNW